MDPQVTASIIQAGVQGVNATGNWLGNRASQRRAFGYNVRSWRMMNKYNHPKAQVERLRSAGLNPDLMYGGAGSPGGASGNTQQFAKYQAPQFQMHPIDIADIKLKTKQGKYLETQGSTQETQAALNKAKVLTELVTRGKLQAETKARIVDTIEKMTLLPGQKTIQELSIRQNRKQLGIMDASRESIYQKINESKQMVKESAVRIDKMLQDIELSKVSVQEAKSRIANNAQDWQLKSIEQGIKQWELMQKRDYGVDPGVGATSNFSRMLWNALMNKVEQINKLKTDDAIIKFVKEYAEITKQYLKFKGY
jgi:hypothetical protein